MAQPPVISIVPPGTEPADGGASGAAQGVRLTSRCAATALLALPAALHWGVPLIATAEAQTTIDLSKSGTAYLSEPNAYPAGGPFTITAGTTIAGGRYGVYGAGDVTISNAGTVTAADHSSTAPAGIFLQAGGSLTNQASGVIGGAENGVVVANGTGIIGNEGTIDGAAYNGISLNHGGTIVNGLGGLIEGGHIGAYAGFAASILTNDGSIIGGSGDGVSLYQGGQFSNGVTGTVTGGYAGVYLGGLGGEIQNNGLVTGTSYGVIAHGGGTVDNGASGQLRGGRYGLWLRGGGAAENAGVIEGGRTGILVSSKSGDIVNSGLIRGDTADGVDFVGGGTLWNQPGGVVAGGAVGVLAGTGVTVTNAGLIASSQGNGMAVRFQGDDDMLVLDSGAELTGGIDGGGGNSQILLQGTGSLANQISDFGDGSALTIMPGADWTAAGQWTIANVTNNGVLQPGAPGTPLSITGNFLESATGTLRIAVTPLAISGLNISGTATLAGRLVYVFAPGLYGPRAVAFLTAASGVTGSLASIEYPGAVASELGAATSMTPDALVLRLAGGVVQPQDDGIFAAQNQFMGEAAQQAGTRLLDKATQSIASPPPACASPAAFAAGSPVDGISPNGTNQGFRAAVALGSLFCRAGGWMEASGDIFAAGDGETAYHADGGGFLAGLDRPLGDFGTRLGLALGYDENQLSDAASGAASVNAWRFGIYGAQPFGQFTLAANFLYTSATISDRRATGTGTANAQSNAAIFSGALQASTRISLASFALQPAAGLQLAAVQAGGFTEADTGLPSGFGLMAQPSAYTSIRPFLSLAVIRQFLLPSSLLIQPQLNLGYARELARQGAVTVTAADGTPFSTLYNPLGSDIGELGASVSAGRNRWSLYARYRAELAGNWTAQTGQFGLRLNF